MRKLIVGLFLTSLTPSSFSQDNNDIAITFAGWTHHLGSNSRNQDNYIYGVRYHRYEVSTMINSFDNRSYIVSYHKKWAVNDFIDIGTRAGFITGYTKDENKFQLLGVTPMLSPTIDFHYKNIGFETALQADVLVFSLNFKFA